MHAFIVSIIVAVSSTATSEATTTSVVVAASKSTVLLLVATSKAVLLFIRFLLLDLSILLSDHGNPVIIDFEVIFGLSLLPD